MKIGVKKDITTEKTRNIITENSRFPVVEAYKIARTNLMFTVAATNNKFVVFTSWSKGEGKSTVTSNMAISLAKLGKKVLLIDADLRKPNVNNLLKITNGKGLSEVLGKFEKLEDVIKKDVLPDLDVITSGVVPPNPSELLGSTHLKELFDKVEPNYDYILIDTPPVGIVTDAIIMKELVAGYVFIVRERSTTHGDIEKFIQTLKLADAPILGIVESNCDYSKGKGTGKKGYGNYYYYNSYY